MKRPFTALALVVVLQSALPAFGESTDDIEPLIAVAPERHTQIVRGTVAAVDEGSDRIALRLPNRDSEDFGVETFKVQDGLVFNAVRFGDQVEVTVESVDGARTIVALKKE